MNFTWPAIALKQCSTTTHRPKWSECLCACMTVREFDSFILHTHTHTDTEFLFYLPYFLSVYARVHIRFTIPYRQKNLLPVNDSKHKRVNQWKSLFFFFLFCCSDHTDFLLFFAHHPVFGMELWFILHLIMESTCNFWKKPSIFCVSACILVRVCVCKKWKSHQNLYLW